MAVAILRLVRTRIVGAISLGVVCLAAVQAAPIQHRGIFVYSTLCRGEEDEGGARFVVMRLADGDMVAYTYAEGAIMAPLLAYGPDARIDESAGTVRFRFLLTDSPTGKPEPLEFVGTIADELLVLKRDGQQDLKLPRVVRPSEELPHCRPS